jgi:DNA-binding transcriptional regulator YiaG
VIRQASTPSTAITDRTSRFHKTVLPEGAPLTVRNIRDEYGLRSHEQRLRDQGLIPLTEMAALLGVSTSTVKAWHHAGIVSGQRYNDKGQVLYYPPGPNPPAKHQGRPLSSR